MDTMRFSDRHRQAMAERINSQIQKYLLYEDKYSANDIKILLCPIKRFNGLFSIYVFTFIALYKKQKSTRVKLFETISSLEETNYLKDSYIGYYLNLYSAFINKCEGFRKNIIRLTNPKQYSKLSEIEID